MSATIEHIRAIANLRDNKPSMETFLLKYGFSMPKSKRRMRRGRMKECFRNAAIVALNNDGLVYCEGYAMSVIPVHHAWIMDSEGNAIDVTWPNGTDYFGVPFKTRFMIREMIKTGYYGLLCQWWSKNPIEFRKHPERFIYETTTHNQKHLPQMRGQWGNSPSPRHKP